MIYVFECVSPDHPKSSPRVYDQVVHGIPDGKVIDRYPCSECGGVAKRRFDKEIPTQSVVGITPISHSTTVKGSPAHEIETAFGRFKQNPDGSVDKNHTRFSSTGEMQQYMDGKNTLGVPVMNDRGEPVKRKDGTLIRQGAKLFKYSSQATPSRTDNPRHINPVKRGARWVGKNQADGFKDVNSRDILKRSGY